MFLLLQAGAPVWISYARQALPPAAEQKTVVMKKLKKLSADRKALALLSVERTSAEDLRTALDVIKLMKPRAGDILVAKMLKHEEVTVRRAAA